MSCLSEKLINTLSQPGDVRIPLSHIQQQCTPLEFQEQCMALVSNGSISVSDGHLYMTSRQKQTKQLLF